MVAALVLPKHGMLRNAQRKRLVESLPSVFPRDKNFILALELEIFLFIFLMGKTLFTAHSSLEGEECGDLIKQTANYQTADDVAHFSFLQFAGSRKFCRFSDCAYFGARDNWLSSHFCGTLI